MHVIHKHEIMPGLNKLEIPDFAQLLSVAFQGDGLFVWERHHVDEAPGVRAVIVLPTGVEHQSELLAPFFATAHHQSRPYVLHVFALERVSGPGTGNH